MAENFAVGRAEKMGPGGGAGRGRMMLGTRRLQWPRGDGILALTVAAGLRNHLTDGETEGQVGRVAWPKLPPKLLTLWVGQVSVDLL